MPRNLNTKKNDDLWRLDTELKRTVLDRDYGQLPLDQYLLTRVIKARRNNSRRATLRAMWHTTLVFLTLFGTAFTPLLSSTIWASKSREEYIPFVLALVAAVKSLIYLFQLDSAVANYNDAFTDLTDAEIRGLGLNNCRYLQAKKEKIVDTVESAILSRVQYTVTNMEKVKISANDSSRKKPKGSKTSMKSNLRKGQV